MFQSVLEQQATEVERHARALVRAVDPDAIPASEAVRIYERLDRAGRAVAAAKTLLARRVEDSQEWKRLGYRCAAELLAARSGTSLGAARAELDTSTALADQPQTKAALVDGTISPAQGSIIADAAKANPAAQQDLIATAGRSNLAELRDAAGRTKAAADPDPMATHQRIHRERRLSRFTDSDGACTLRAHGTVTDGSIIAAEIDRLTDRIFRARGRAGTTECRDAYQWDALVEMARRSAGTTNQPSGTARQPRPQHLALLRLDVSALWRGHVEGGELCEITGVGPIPVEVARRLLGDAVLKLILTNGIDVASVTSLTRSPTQAMRYAHLWTSPTCSVEGCSRTIIEYDHRHGAEFKDTGHTRFDETTPVCPGHHDLHTHLGWALLPGPGKRAMVPPDDPRHPANTGPPSQARTGPAPPGEPAAGPAPATTAPLHAYHPAS